MIDYSEDWLLKLLFQVRGSVALRACTFAIPCAALSAFLVCLDDWAPDIRSEWGLEEPSKSQLWTATTAVLGTLLVFRTNRAMARFWEGTGLLHQMRGEWFDSISCCVTFSNGALKSKRREVKRFRHTIVRLMSLCHGSALEEIAGNDREHAETIDCLGLDNTTLCYLKSCKEELNFNRVEVLLHLTQSIITKSLDEGILRIPPPILSRVYQTLSRGFVNLLNAKKIADTRFPFPYAQLIAMLLFMHVLLTPIMISCVIPNKVWAPIFTFIPIFGMFSLNFIGVELENPFGNDENDLPLEHFQSEMNKCLLMLLHEGSDIIADINDSRCIMKYKELAASMDLVSTRLTGVRLPSQRKSVSSFTDWSEVTNIYEDGHYNKWGSEASNQSPTMSHSGTSRSSRADPGHLSRGGTTASLKPVEETLESEELTLPDDNSAGSKNAVLGSTELVAKYVLELRRSIIALTQFSDALHGIVDRMSTHADTNGIITMRHVEFEKRGDTHATSLLAQLRTSNDCCDVDHVTETKSWLAPPSPTQQAPSTPVQEASIQPTIESERIGTVLQSVRCHPSSGSVKTPREGVALSEQT